MQSYSVRLTSGVIGVVVTSLKPKELMGRFAMAITVVDGKTIKRYGVVSHIYEQHELELEL